MDYSVRTIARRADNVVASPPTTPGMGESVLCPTDTHVRILANDAITPKPAPGDGQAERTWISTRCTDAASRPDGCRRPQTLAGSPPGLLGGTRHGGAGIWIFYLAAVFLGGSGRRRPMYRPSSYSADRGYAVTPEVLAPEVLGSLQEWIQHLVYCTFAWLARRLLCLRRMYGYIVGTHECGSMRICYPLPSIFWSTCTAQPRRTNHAQSGDR